MLAMVGDGTVDDVACFASRLRERKPDGLSYPALSRRLYDLLGDDAVTPDTLASMHRGQGRLSPERHLLVVCALADVYGCSISDLSPTAADRLRALFPLLRRQHALIDGPMGAEADVG